MQIGNGELDGRPSTASLPSRMVLPAGVNSGCLSCARASCANMMAINAAT
jgi:hypothetical protein